MKTSSFFNHTCSDVVMGFPNKEIKEDKSFKKTDQEWKKELPKMSYLCSEKQPLNILLQVSIIIIKQWGPIHAGCNTPLYDSENNMILKADGLHLIVQ